jgi:hypothetical protein
VSNGVGTPMASKPRSGSESYRGLTGEGCPHEEALRFLERGRGRGRGLAGARAWLCSDEPVGRGGSGGPGAQARRRAEDLELVRAKAAWGGTPARGRRPAGIVGRPRARRGAPARVRRRQGPYPDHGGRPELGPGRADAADLRCPRAAARAGGWPGRGFHRRWRARRGVRADGEPHRGPHLAVRSDRAGRAVRSRRRSS